ncbi:MAG: recombinase RecA [Myxococcaceae bacterium]|nr:recombinase RecA [Myxococcaceae bacterium]
MASVAAEAGRSAPERFGGDGQRRAQVVEHLKEQIRRVQAAPRRYLVTLATGVAELDALGVFRLGGAVELSGEEASGRTSVALSLVASACREKRLAAWVDGPQELYPPAAVPMGVELKRLLVVRPPAPGQLVWSAVQLLRSGAFTCVVLDVTHTGVQLTMTDTKKLLDAARAGGSLLVVLTANAAPAQGLLRLVMATRAGQPSMGGAHLRLVSAPPQEAEPEPEVHVEVARAQGVTGRRLVVPRARLAKLTRGRRAQAVLPGLELPRVAPAESLQRPKKNHQRDGQGFHVVTRPGREGPLALPLEGALHSPAPPGNRRRPAAKLAALDAVRATQPGSVTPPKVKVRSFR